MQGSTHTAQDTLQFAQTVAACPGVGCPSTEGGVALNTTQAWDSDNTGIPKCRQWPTPLTIYLSVKFSVIGKCEIKGIMIYIYWRSINRLLFSFPKYYFLIFYDLMESFPPSNSNKYLFKYIQTVHVPSIQYINQEQSSMHLSIDLCHTI